MKEKIESFSFYSLDLLHSEGPLNVFTLGLKRDPGGNVKEGREDLGTWWELVCLEYTDGKEKN
jgi:hypothetical protein